MALLLETIVFKYTNITQLTLVDGISLRQDGRRQEEHDEPDRRPSSSGPTEHSA